MKNLLFKSNICKLFILILILVTNLLVSVNALAESDNKENQDSLLFLGNQNYPPMVYIENASVKGVAVDVTIALGERMGRSIEIEAMDWAEAQKIVEHGGADALIQINETEDRRKVFDFSDPLFESKFSIFTLTKRSGITGISDLRGLRVGVEAKGYPVRILQPNPLIQLVNAPSILEAFHMLEEGSVDAVIVDQWVGTYILANSSINGVQIVGDPIAKLQSSIAVKKGNTGLLSEINKGLKDIKEDGTYQRIIKKWQPKEVVFFTRDQIRLRQYQVGIGILALFVILTIVWVLLLLRQLSKSKQLEQELRSQKELLDAVIENIPDPFGIYDKDSNLIKMNAAGRKLYPQQEIIKTINLCHSSFEYFDLEGNEILPEDLPACRAYRGEFVRNAVIVIKRAEKEQITEVNATPIYDKDNNLVSMASYHRDITEMVLNQREIKKHEELQIQIKMEQEMVRLDKLSLVGAVAAGIGHEVRNPMTTVRGFLQLLSTKEDCSKYNDYFALMIDELDRANSIITEFLSLAKDRVVEFKVESLKEIVETIYPLIQANGLVSDKYIHLDLEEVPEFPLDKKEINQLILNLVLNGSHAMSPGGNLRIRTFMDKGKIVLSVQDDGGGIAQDVLDKIGTPFFTTKENGTGLGLAVCYSIAARHNAKIDIETGATGTTFFVRFESN